LEKLLWTAWQPDKTLARWDRVPRRLSDDGSARAVWFALRDANAEGLVSVSGGGLGLGTNFGLQLVVHATRRGPRNAISYSERLADGSIAAFHNDRYPDELLSVLAPSFPGVTEEELRCALDHPAGPLFTTPAIHTTPGFIQISPADERCSVGELTIRQDSTSRWPELSGELFTIRPIDALLPILGTDDYRCKPSVPNMQESNMEGYWYRCETAVRQ
jgi:hypothetical protein